MTLNLGEWANRLEIRAAIQKDLDRLEEWPRRNLKVNKGECKVVAPGKEGFLQWSQVRLPGQEVALGKRPWWTWQQSGSRAGCLKELCRQCPRVHPWVFSIHKWIKPWATWSDLRAGPSLSRSRTENLLWSWPGFSCDSCDLSQWNQGPHDILFILLYNSLENALVCSGACHILIYNSGRVIKTLQNSYRYKFQIQ